jgi:hypothetical protein
MTHHSTRALSNDTSQWQNAQKPMVQDDIVVADLHEAHTCTTNLAACHNAKYACCSDTAKLPSQNKTKREILVDVMTVFEFDRRPKCLSSDIKSKTVLPSWLFAWGPCEAGCQCPAEP